MANTSTAPVGTIAALWRYPVKSMRGEDLQTVEITERGLYGDRAYALIDEETGRVVSVKNPRKWGDLVGLQASLDGNGAATSSNGFPPARIALENGEVWRTDSPDISERLSERIGRKVHLASAPPPAPRLEGYWPDYEWLEHRDQTYEVEMPPGTFFDGALVHFVTNATLKRLLSLCPDSDFDVRRFRPSFLLNVPDADAGFIEDSWIGRNIAVGATARLHIHSPCPRCVITTLPWAGLPKDPHILRTAVQGNKGFVGVYASVLRGGEVKLGDQVALD